MATYKFLPKIELNLSATDWNINEKENSGVLANLLNIALASLIEKAWEKVNDNHMFSIEYTKIENAFDDLLSKHLDLTDVDCMRVFYKIVDIFFTKEMVLQTSSIDLTIKKPKSSKPI